MQIDYHRIDLEKGNQMTTTNETITETEDQFVQIITDWENRQILTTLTRKEREQEYLVALDKLQDFIKKEEEKEDYDTMKEIRRCRIEMSLHDHILTDEEKKEEQTKWIEEYEKETGKKLNLLEGWKK